MYSCGLTDRGLVRRDNQDAYYAYCNDKEQLALLVVCDGMGGANAGNIASKLSVEVFVDDVKKSIRDCDSEPDFNEILLSAVAKTNDAVFKQSCARKELRGMGTTMVAALVYGEKVVVINIGDSRAYKINAEYISQMTKDHSVIEDLIDRGEITRDEAKHHPNRNLITRAIGTAPQVECDLFKTELKDGDYLLLCSDGLSNIITDDELYYAVTSTDNIKESCGSLLELAMSRGAPDNVTMIILQK